MSKLNRELKKTDATDTDVARLLDVAERVKASDAPHLSRAARARIKAIPNADRPVWPRVTSWSFAGAMAVFVVMIVAAQGATAGSPLYFLKEGTDSVRAFIQPEYRDDIVDQKKDTLQQLEEAEAPEQEIIEAEDAYINAVEKSSEEKQEAERESWWSSRDESSDDDRDRHNHRDRDRSWSRDSDGRSDRRDSDDDHEDGWRSWWRR